METEQKVLEKYLSEGKIKTLKALGFYEDILKALCKTQTDWYNEGLSDGLNK